MARQAGVSNENNSDLDKDVNRLTALFKGRFNNKVAGELIQEFGGLQQAAHFLMLGNEDEVQKRLHESDEYLKSLRVDSEKFCQVINSTHEDRQFGCADCNNGWWKRVPEHKPVSKCFRCYRKFDPVPRENEWGIGKFECKCGNCFKGFGIMGRTKSQCRECFNEVDILEILPPKKDFKPRRRTSHNCNGVNCYRGYESFADNDEKPPTCIHPRSPEVRSPVRVHYASQLHVSTGSTINTILDQGSLDTSGSSLALSLETIEEED